jgi:hypothetical protein
MRASEYSVAFKLRGVWRKITFFLVYYSVHSHEENNMAFKFQNFHKKNTSLSSIYLSMP